ncbi:MAG: hypothetical protein AAGJ46_08840 [Planctomycetota bacterium]
MATGLEEEEGALQTAMGLPGKKKKGSTKQADQFKAAFQGKMSGVNKDLQYTAAHAEPGKHAAQQETRGGLVSKFQAVLNKIDPANPKAADAAIKKVLGGMDGLATAVSSLQKATQKAMEAWTGKQGIFDRVSDKTGEMTEWGHPKAGSVAEILKKVAEAANEKKYDGATKAFAGLEKKFGAIEKDFDAQVAAQKEYDAALPGAEAALEPTRSCEFASLSERQEQLIAAEEAMHKMVSEKDFVSAAAQVKSVEAEAKAITQEVEKLTQDRSAYEEANESLAPRLSEASTCRFPETADLDKQIIEQTDKSETEAKEEKFADALLTVQELGKTVDEKLELEAKLAAKEEYEKAAKAEEANLKAADALTKVDHFKVEQAGEAYKKAKKALDDLVAAEKWEEALAKLPEVASLAKAYADLHKGFIDFDKELKKEWASFSYLHNLRNNTVPGNEFKAEAALITKILGDYHTGNFAAATAALKTLKPKIADVKKRVAEHDKKTQPKADAATAEIKKLAGGKDLSTLSGADLEKEKKKLIKELKKLTPEKQRQLLEDMHGPSAALTPEQREMQAALYRSMELDADFKKADAKTREKYQKELQADKELQKGMTDWNAKDAKGNPLVDVEQKKKLLKKVLVAQSKAYGIDVPEIDWYDKDDGNFGTFSSDSNRIRLNTKYMNDPEEMINTVIHENTHNYQFELVEQYLAGKIKKSDPRYEQARTFVVNSHWDSYAKGSSPGNPRDDQAYAKQPIEMQAWDAGDNEAKKLYKALTKPK